MDLEWMNPCDRDMVGKPADKATYAYLDKIDRAWKNLETVFYFGITGVIVASSYYGITLRLPLWALVKVIVGSRRR